MSAMQGPIRSGHKNPSPGLCSAKALRKHIVDFKEPFYSARPCTKTNWISVNGKIYPWEDFELHNADGTTAHEGPSLPQCQT